MAGSAVAPVDQYLGTNIVEKNDSIAWEVADFLFGAKSIKRILDGEGTWGDAALLGITAATFLIPPAKIAQLGTKALRKVLGETIIVNAAYDGLPIAAKAAAKTRAEVEAELVRRGQLTYVEPLKAEVPTLPMSEARFKKITGPEPEEVIPTTPAYELKKGTKKFIPPAEIRALKDENLLAPRVKAAREVLADDTSKVKAKKEAQRFLDSVDNVYPKKISLTQKEIDEGADLNLPENVRVSSSTAIEDAFTPEYVPKPEDPTIPRQLSSDKTRYAADAPPIELTEKLIDEIDDLYKKIDKLSDAEFNSRRAQILLQLFPGKLAADIPNVTRSTTELFTSSANITNLKKKEIIRILKKSEDPDRIRLAEELQDLDLKTLKQEVVKMGDGTRSIRENPYETTPARSAIQPQLDEVLYQKERLETMLKEASSPMEPADAGVIKRLTSEIDKLDKQAIKLQEYIDNPLSDAAIAQSTDIIPNVRSGRTSMEFLPPTSYRAMKPKPKRIEAPDNPQRVSLSELKADREEILMLPESKSREQALKQIDKEIADLESKQVPKVVDGSKPRMTTGLASTKKEIEKLEKEIDDLRVEYTNITEPKKMEDGTVLSVEKQKKLIKASAQAKADMIEKLKNPLSELFVKETPLPPKRRQWKRAPNTREVRTTQFDLEKAKKELEILRQKYKETPAKDFVKREKLKEKGKILAAKIKAFDKPVVKTESDVVIKNNSEVTFHSGMANGADTAWAEAADAVGIKTIGHSFKGHRVSGNRPAMETRNELTEEQLQVADEFLEKAAMRMGEKYNPVANTPEEIARINLLRRNYYQIKDADAVIAITELAPKSTLKTLGGTRYAVQMGIDKGIPVYVFDQVKKSWFKWDGESFVKSDLPPVYKSPATVGRREKDLLPSGKTAIKDYMEQFAEGTTKAKASESSNLVVRWNNLTKAEQEDAVYIGRPKPGQDGKFGNEYRVTDTRTVEEAVELYRKDLWKRIKSDPEYAKDVYALKGKKLGCPGPEADDACHGQVILKAIEYLDNNPELMSIKPIDSFRGANSFLSNMSSSPFKVGQTEYPTVEHFYQAMKTDIPEERAKILAARTASEAKRIGRTVKLRKNWSKIQIEVMDTALRAKFQQNPELKKKLIDTGEAELIEGNTWNDKFWGVVNGEGTNWLGKLLMQIRKDLMEGN